MMRESAERQTIIEERRKDVDSIENVAESAGYMVSEISDQNNLSIQIEKMDFTDSGQLSGDPRQFNYRED